MNLTPKQTIKGTVAEAQSLKGVMKEVPSLDKTLTKEGFAADAKAVGDALKTKAPISHTEDRGNPHGVTASQVGARPDTWMPSASEIGARPNTWIPTSEEVGARPNTWTPTAEQVGARPNTWTPTATEVGAAPAGYPNASMGEQWGNYGGADAGKFDYWAYLYVTEYTGGVVDVYLQGKFTVEPNSTFNYGIDTTAVLAKINEMTGKNYTTWETQRTLSASIIDAKTGVTTSSLIGYLLCFLRRTNASKLYLAISRVHNSSGNAGSWSLQQIHDATSDGSAYMNLHLRAKLS